jgi:hypothetical protein
LSRVRIQNVAANEKSGLKGCYVSNNFCTDVRKEGEGGQSSFTSVISLSPPSGPPTHTGMVRKAPELGALLVSSVCWCSRTTLARGAVARGGGAYELVELIGQVDG